MTEKEQYLGAQIEECAQEIINESPASEEEIEKLLQEKAEELEAEMKDKYGELTGKENACEQEELYINMIREQLLRYKFITPEDDEQLKEKYKVEGKIGKMRKETEQDEKNLEL